jgi:spore maturation protein CgeB
MRVVMFCHSLISDWNHGNAHFLRGVAGELLSRGHAVSVFEPRDSWSMANLLRDHGPRAVAGFHAAYPTLSSVRFDEHQLDLDEALDGAQLVLVHEWNSHSLVKRIGRHRSRTHKYALLFHDTHHRSVSDPDAMGAYDLDGYDGVLAFGEVIRQHYLVLGWARRAWTWHEAADTTKFRPADGSNLRGDVVWIGNWGDDERSEEIRRYLIEPVRALGLRAEVHGVRYPADAVDELDQSGIAYRGWLPNYSVPAVFARFAATVHIPRQPYLRMLPGIPTIRMFEALACGMPLVSCRWDDCEGLFTAGSDYLSVDSPAGMLEAMRALINDSDLRRQLAQSGCDTIRTHHTCAHRVDQLLNIAASIRSDVPKGMTA